MAKAGMRRYGPADDYSQNHPVSTVSGVPEIQGKAKHAKEKARPIIAGTHAPHMKVYHSQPHADRKISSAYLAIDNDLARDNLENHLPAAELEDN